MELRTIRLYGKLGAKFGRVFRMAVNSPAEAVRALCIQLPGFEQYLMTAKDRNEGYAVFIGKRNLAEDELQTPASREDIRIAPVILGAKSGWATVILGAALIASGMWVATMTFANAAAIGGAISGIGVSMAIGGVTQLLTGRQGVGDRESPDNQPSHAFNGAVNTQAQGHPVPLLYGELICGSAVISAGIQVEDMFAPATTTGNGVGPGGFNSEWGRNAALVSV